MGIFANLLGILAPLLPGIWDIGSPPIQASLTVDLIKISFNFRYFSHPISLVPMLWLRWPQDLQITL